MKPPSVKKPSCMKDAASTEDRVDKGAGNGKTGSGLKRGHDTLPSLFPLATRATSEQAGL